MSDFVDAFRLTILTMQVREQQEKRKGMELHIRKELEMQYGIDDITENEDALIEYQSAIAALSEEQEIPEYIEEDIEVFPVFSNGSVVSAPLYFQTADSNKRYSLSDISHTIAGSTNGPMSFMEADIVRYFVRVRKLNPAYRKEDQPSIQKREVVGKRYVQLMNSITNETKWYNVPDDMELKLGDSIDLTRIGPPLNHMPLGGQIATIV